jgi:hypothetical protein
MEGLEPESRVKSREPLGLEDLPTHLKTERINQKSRNSSKFLKIKIKNNVLVTRNSLIEHR